MVGRAGAEQSAPGSMLTGYANPVRLTTSAIGVSCGEFSEFNIEAAIMATIPTITQPEVTIFNGQAVTSSLAIADYFTKRHERVLDKIRNLECSSAFAKHNFVLSEYTDTTGRKLPCYQITRDGFAFLAMGFTGKRAAQFKEAYITAFNQMEYELQRQAASSYRVLLNFREGQLISSTPIGANELIVSPENLADLICQYPHLFNDVVLWELIKSCLRVVRMPSMEVGK